MEQKVLKNISGTVCVLGVALSAISINSTMIVKGCNDASNVFNNRLGKTYSNSMMREMSNIYITESSTRLEKEANAIFGEMRNATLDEQASVNKYIKSISKYTGIDFFSIC